VIVHDHFDDRKHGGEVAAPEDGDDGRREDAGRDVDSVREREFQCASEIVHIRSAAARPLSLLAWAVRELGPRFVAKGGRSSKGGGISC